MTSRERVFCAIHHKEPDGIPYEMRMESLVADRLDAYYGTSLWRDYVDNDIRRITAYSCWGWEKTDSNETLQCDPYGNLWRTYGSFWLGDMGAAPSLEKPALEDIALQDYTFPKVELLLTPNWQTKTAEQIKNWEGYFLTTSIDFGVFDRTLMMCGHEQGYMDMAGEESPVIELLDRVTDHLLDVIDVLARLKVDAIFIGDDWGDQRGVIIGPDRWRKLIKPRTARLIERIHQSGKMAFYHSCGNVSDIIGDLIEIKLDVLESIQPEAMNPYELKRDHGDGITFWGGLGSQSLMPFGTPQEVRAETHKLVNQMGAGGGYILGPTKTLQVDTPVANAAAAVEAFIEAKQGCLSARWPRPAVTNT